MASLDAARWQFGSSRGNGRALLRQAHEMAQWVRMRIREDTGFNVLEEDNDEARTRSGSFVALDPLRITVHAGQGWGGYDLDEVMIEQHGVYAEMPAARTLTFAIGPGTTEDDGKRLVQALTEISQQAPEVEEEESAKVGDSPTRPPSSSSSREDLFKGIRRLCTPREAYFSPSEVVRTDDSSAILGRASAEVVCPYPPGIPLLLPGEIVTEECLTYLRGVLDAGGSVTGCADSTFQRLRVLCSNKERSP